jgi:hypothetical protein
MPITHEEARRLIHLRADEALKSMDDNPLQAHLRSCVECQNYAASIHDLESTLQPLLQRRWNQIPLPLSTENVVSRNHIRLTQSLFFATRIVALGVICIAFLFNIWQFAGSGKRDANPPSAEIPLIPTPSMHSTTTKVMEKMCASVLYEVRQNDTLDSIAIHFSVSRDEILQANHLAKATLATGMKLSIPVCSPTPSRTPDTIITTYTPLLGSSTITPADGTTQ